MFTSRRDAYEFLVRGGVKNPSKRVVKSFSELSNMIEVLIRQGFEPCSAAEYVCGNYWDVVIDMKKEVGLL